MVDAGQLHANVLAWSILGQLLNSGIQVKKKSPVTIVSNHALNPEEGCHSRSSGHGRDSMQAGAG